MNLTKYALKMKSIKSIDKFKKKSHQISYYCLLKHKNGNLTISLIRLLN